MNMNRDIYSALREERRRELLTEVNELRQARQISRRSSSLGRRAIGRLGSMMIAAGSRLEQIERRERAVAYDA